MTVQEFIKFADSDEKDDFEELVLEKDVGGNFEFKGKTVSVILSRRSDGGDHDTWEFVVKIEEEYFRYYASYNSWDGIDFSYWTLRNNAEKVVPQQRIITEFVTVKE